MGVPTALAAVQTMDVIYLNVWSILISLLNLLLLYFAFKKFLYKPVKEILQKRKSEVDNLYQEASDAKSAAEADQALYAEKLQSAQTEADAILRAAGEKAQRRSQEILSDAAQSCAAMKKTASAEIEQERKKALNEVKSEISSISLQIAEKMVGRQLDGKDQQALLDQFLSDLEGEQ